MSELVLEVVTPASLELSIRAAQEFERERAALDRQWQLRLERASQEANRAFRQYNAVEPENRLVARSLERAWEESLLAQRALEEEYRRFQKAQPTRLSPAERAQIESLRAIYRAMASATDIIRGEAPDRAAAVAIRGGLGAGVEQRSEGTFALGVWQRDRASGVPPGGSVEAG